MISLLFVRLFAAMASGAPAPDAAPVDYVATRAAVVSSVVQSAPDLRAARHRTDAHRSMRDQVSIPDPRVSFASAPLSVADASAPVGAQVSVSQSLPFPGTLAPLRDQHTALADAEAASTEHLVLRLSLEAARTVDAVARIDQTMALLQEHRGLLAELSDSATARFEAGSTTADGPLQVGIELDHVDHRLVVLASERRVALAQLRRLGAVDTELPVFTDVSGPRVVEEPGRTHPALVAAAGQVDASEHAVRGARRATRPDLSVSTTYNTMWRMPTHRWMVGVGVEVPLQWGARQASVRSARATHAAAVASEESVALAVDADRDIARIRFDEAVHIVALYETSLVPTARARVEAVRASFESTGAFEPLIRAERHLRDTEIQHAESVAMAWSRHAELRVALGRLPVEPVSDNQEGVQ